MRVNLVRTFELRLGARVRRTDGAAYPCHPVSYDDRTLDTIDRIAQSHGRVTVVRLASDAQLSPSRLRHLFRSAVGISVSRFALHYRLHLAAHALLDPANAVKAAQHEAGFADAANFAHYFRQHFGSSPSTFRDFGACRPLLPPCACEPQVKALLLGIQRQRPLGLNGDHHVYAQ